MGKEYNTEKSYFGDHTNIYDENGNKIGTAEKSFFDDHINIYDATGKKIATQEESLFGDQKIVYDSSGRKIVTQEQALFGDHDVFYDANGRKVGSGYSSEYSFDDAFSGDSSTSPVNRSTPLKSEPNNVPKLNTPSQHTVLSSEMYSNISEKELAQTIATSHELTPDEAKAFAKLCVGLLEKANIKTDGTIFSQEQYKKKVRHGFLNLKSYETTKTRYIPGAEYWLLRRRNENEDRAGYLREEKYILALTKSGKFYDGEIREDYRKDGGHVLIKNDWEECSPYQLYELIPLLDLLLKKHSIKMSSGLYWAQLHPQASVKTTPSRTEEKVTTAPRASANQQYAYVLTVSKTEEQTNLVKAIRTLYGYGLNEARQWAESSQNIIMQTNDKNKVTEAINIFEGEYGIQVTING